MASDMETSGRVRVGIGGWNYAPWRGLFYPDGLPHKRELEYASRHVTAIEINSTFYRMQAPSTFARWREETPDDFRFTVKAPRYATQRKVLAEAGDAIGRFMGGGVLELKEKLAAVLWQFAPTKRFEAEDLERFLALLPRESGVSHVLEARHSSFLCPEYIHLARRYGAATVYTDSADYPSYADVTGGIVYARLMKARATLRSGYPGKALDAWTHRASTWARGGEPADLPRVSPASSPPAPRDVYVFMIDGAKERAPAAAQALLTRLATMRA